MTRQQPETETCPFCGVTGDEPTKTELLAKIERCMNCRADVLCRGDWTGYGWAAVQRFLTREKGSK